MALTDGTTTKKTVAIRGERQAVEWNEKLGALSETRLLKPVSQLIDRCSDIRPSSRITLSLYAERSRHEHQLFGTLDIPLEPQTSLF